MTASAFADEDGASSWREPGIDELCSRRAVHVLRVHQIGRPARDDERREVVHLRVGVVPRLAIRRALLDRERRLVRVLAEERPRHRKVRHPTLLGAHADVDVDPQQREPVADGVLAALQDVLRPSFFHLAGERVLDAVDEHPAVDEVHDVVLSAGVVLEIVRVERGVDRARPRAFDDLTRVMVLG